MTILRKDLDSAEQYKLSVDLKDFDWYEYQARKQYEEMIASESEYGEKISEEDEYKSLCEENRQLNKQVCEEE